MPAWTSSSRRFALLALLLAAPLLPTAAQPALRFSTYLGGSELDLAGAVALGDDGAVYVVGHTRSSDFPTRNAAQGYQGSLFLGTDVFAAKLSADGDSLLYATYLGGALGEEMAVAAVVDAQGRLYVAGTTSSPDFPVRGALQGFRAGDETASDGFVARLSADGSAVEFATWLGGSGDETITALALGPDGAVYVAGSTTSTDFPVTPGVVQPARAGDAAIALSDAFVARLTPDGDGLALDYATYLGGGRDDVPRALAVDDAGRAWVAGTTTSLDFPLQDALQTAYAGPIRDLEGDAFVARLSADAAALDVATYLGGAQDDGATGLALDAEGRVYVAGSTMSPDFPTTAGAYQAQRAGLQERFVARLAPAGSAWMLDVSTRLGAADGAVTSRAGLAVDRAGRVWTAGATTTSRFPLRDAAQPGYGGGTTDAFLVRLDADVRTLGYGTFLGGTGADAATSLALGDDALCLAGGTGSPDIPVQAPLQPTFDGPATAGVGLTSVVVTCYGVVNQAAMLAEVAVAPDSVALRPGESVPFAAAGRDQFGQPAPVDVGWTATGGTIDESGLFTAGETVGRFHVTARDEATGLSGTAVVVVDRDLATDDDGLPTAFALYGNYPNPFNPETVIRFDVKAPARVVLTVYNALGRRQATLVDRRYPPGRHEVRLDARDWASGVYFYRIEMGDFRAARRMVLLR